MPNLKSKPKAFKIPRFIINTGKFLEFVSPTIATKYVLKLFMTPHKFKRPVREDKMYMESERKMLLIPSLLKEVQVYKYGNAKKKILLIHGWAGRGTQMYKIAEVFIDLGYESVSFDATAHGESEGKTSAMTEFIPSVMEIEKAYGPFEFAIGHSLGGMVLLNAVKDGLKVKRIALLGSGNSIIGICHQFVSRLELKPKIAERLKHSMDEFLGYDVEKLSSYVAAKSVDIPTLVIHDTDDEDVPVSCAHDIRQNLSEGDIMITEGLGHRRILNDTTVIDKLLTFLLKK